MPLPSSGIIVVENPTASNLRTTNTTTTNTRNSSNTNHPHPNPTHQQLHFRNHQHHSLQQHPAPQSSKQTIKQQKTFAKYYEYCEANDNQLLSSKQHQSKFVVDSSALQNQAQSTTVGGGVAGGRKLSTTTTPLSLSSSTLTSPLSTTTKPNLFMHSTKTGSMPQTNKQLAQQQQIIQHTSHTTTVTSSSSSNSQQQQKQQAHQHLHQQSQQHVQQVHLANTTTAQHQHHQHHHNHHHQQPTQHQAHMIQVSEEFLEQAQVQAQTRTNTSNMMISATGEVIQQQQIFKIVSADAATGNMIIDTAGSNQNPNASGPSKVLLNNLTVLSKQQAIASNAVGQQQSAATGQSINFVNAKQLYSTSTTANPAGSAGVVTALGKQQKFTVASANIGSAGYKATALKQTNTQYVHASGGGQQKISVASSNRNMQMLTTTRVQSSGNSLSNTGVITSSSSTAQTMVLQQPHKFVTTNNVTMKTSTSMSPSSGNVIKKNTGTLRMSNNNIAGNKLVNNMHAQSTQGVKTFITQTTTALASAQQQQQQNIPTQLSSIQQHHTKGGKSKFVKQYNNAILNSAGAVAIATLPHQHNQNNLSSSTSGQQQSHHHQQQHQLQAQSTYINHHHKTTGGGAPGAANTTTTKIHKINSKYAPGSVAAQLPPGTQLHQKTLSQIAQPQTLQQYQTTTNNSNIKFVNAQGTIIQQQQQPLTPQKIHIKQQPQYQSLQNLDAIDGNNSIYAQQQQQQIAGASNSSATPNSTLLSDDIMMVNGTQMTDELSARILQSMSQKSFTNQRYQQLQQPPHPVFQKSSTNNNNNNMLPPNPAANTSVTNISTQQAASSVSNMQNAQNNNSNILLSPREYTLYPPSVGSGSLQQCASPSQQPQTQSSPNHYSAALSSANIVVGAGGGIPSSSATYMTNSMATITPHSISGAVGSSSTSRMAQSAPNSRSQSMERKLHESSMSRKSSELYKVNNHNSLRGSHSNLAAAQTSNIAGTSLPPSSLSPAASASSTLMATTGPPPSRPPSIPSSSSVVAEAQTQVMHLPTAKSQPLGSANNSCNDNEDIIGEEVRPVPVEAGDLRLRILHAVLLDHTYANPMPLELPTTFAVQLPASGQSNVMNSTSSHLVGAGPASSGSVATQQHQQWSLGGIGAVTGANSSGSAIGNSTSQYAMYTSQLSKLQQDDDAYSAISNSSNRIAIGDIDPGEETETAPEAEAEDDSITRCICDLTHDDGYMICCDKCCAWQHVDCMGIDRQNIPDEYLCELCQPRPVDKARARNLQVQKRKEQQTLMMTQAANLAGTIGAAGSASGSGGMSSLLPNDILATQHRLPTGTVPGFGLPGNNIADTNSLQHFAPGGPSMKKGTKMLKKLKDSTGGKKSKKEKLAAAGGGLAGKSARKETKKSTKRKKGTHEGGSTVGMTAVEKHAANLRQWIENYELAVTNHYSPELRARLHGITKQPSLLQSIINTENPALKEFSLGNLENRATTVPHAGGKILISNLDIAPFSPICELRGKYMLTTQYKTQNASMNMNTPPPNNYHLGSYKAHKTPGPFIFFYQLKGAEGSHQLQAVPQSTTTTSTTINPDGTFTTTTTTLPAQLSPPGAHLKGPEICVDTRTYGNEARFVRRSCRPNAEIQHLFEKGTIHLFIVALTSIRASTEITIRHEPHDILAVENKKPNIMVIQPTSTQCACGLSKDCIFGPPLPQLPPAAKSNAGRKALAQNGGTGNLTAKQRKTNQQNLNRNRSTSSSGDSNMGGVGVSSSSLSMTPIPTVALSQNSPNNNLLGVKMGKQLSANTNSNNSAASAAVLLPLTASCNSNLSNASSTSSTLTSIMHDSGICTSSSSPSVSIPSPTQHMHSPIQQLPHPQQLQQQQQHQQHLRPVQILPHPQHHQQQLMQSLPTPLILPTEKQPLPQQQQQQLPNITQHQQQQVLLPSPQHQLPQLQQQPITVISQAPPATLRNQEVKLETHPEQMQINLYITSPKPQQIQQMFSPRQQQPHQQQQPATPSPTLVRPALESPLPEVTLTTPVLQPMLCAQPIILATPTVDTTLQPMEPIMAMPSTDVPPPHQLPMIEPPLMSPSVALPVVSNAETLVCTPPSTSSPQQQKSPQKNYPTHHNNANHGRKTPAKNARTTSFSEDMEHANDENSVSATPNSASTPKDKPKLSREDRKMEAILKAIEKMERNQQRKQEQKQTKRQNSGSHNTTPTSPNKTFDSADSSGTKRSNSQSAGGPSRTKKKRKSGNRGTGHNSQRKRRQSRMNSQESVDGCAAHEHDTVTSESDSCAAMHSPPIQTVASLKHLPLPSAEASPSVSSENIPNNVDQAAGLLMAFANPDVSSPTEQAMILPAANNNKNQTPSPQRPALPPQYMISPHETSASPPCTPPSHLSSACLLIEAAVGPLESNLEPNAEVSSSEVSNTEFKYPLQAKTKKHLMNNWLHQTEEISAVSVSSSLEQVTSPPQLACVSGGLDTLVQAALNDFKQAHAEEIEQPQNLSMVAQRVEEFIQQTERGSPTPPPTKHSYEYEQQQQQLYAMANPAVDLSLKHPTVYAGANAPYVTNNKNFQSSLQISTCSNNSSVKKRWLRQAISEETHEEMQHNYSLTPSPTTPMPIATQVQMASATATCTPALMASTGVPNGFTTPLKKRRLLLTDKDEEENATVNTADLGTPLSPLPVETSPMEQHETAVQESYEQKPQVDQLQNASQHLQEDVDVDVEKCEQTDSGLEQNPTLLKMEQDQDVDILSAPTEQEIKAETVIKHETTAAESNVKAEHDADMLPQTMAASHVEFNDQEDDVDILRSPSPGREMIKAEDNLVKIEPEDTSGNDDVKIDVEREESMAADDVMASQLKHEYKAEAQPQPQTTGVDIKVERIEVKQEPKTESSENSDRTANNMNSTPQAIAKIETLAETKAQSSPIKDEEFEEPKAKKLKLESQPVAATDIQTTIDAKHEILQKNEDVKQENTKVLAAKHEVLSSTKAIMKAEKMRRESEEVSSSTNAAAVKNTTKLAAADSTFSGIESATPPLPTSSESNQTCSSSTAVASKVLQRQKPLSDDDIQARLHSFHKENILFLQSRNKKSKSSNSTSPSSSTSLTGEHHRSNNKGNHHHHHHHDGKEKAEKSEKLSTKHHKNSTSTTTSGSSKKQKLHKRERTTSSSSSSNSHKNSSTISKNVVVNSSTNSLSSTATTSTSSTKKLKSLKKSSSGSSTSSSNSMSLSAVQNCQASNSETKDKHQRQRAISNSSTSSSSTPHTLFGATTKKRQLNFELELTKDMHLLNSVATNSNKHKRVEEIQSHSSAKKSRKDSTSTPKDEHKNGSNKIHSKSNAHLEKSQEKEKKAVAANVPVQNNILPLAAHPATANVVTPVQAEEIKPITATASANTPPAVTALLREHPTLPHFNNVVLTPATSSLIVPPPLAATVTMPSLHPPALSQNIPNHVNNTPTFVTSVHTNMQSQPQLSVTPPTAVNLVGLDISSTSTANSSNPLPFFNTIYGKLLDSQTTNQTSPIAVAAPAVPLPPPPTVLPITSPVTHTPAPPAAGVLSEYLDTKLKSYNTLGGYVSHTALFGLASVGSKESVLTKDVVANEMPAPPAPPSALAIASPSLSLALNIASSAAANVTAPKIHTKTASHDPRLNPQLTAPEPPPQPKRKLSINEYRKRMQQSSSQDSSSSNNNSLTSTPTTPPTPMENTPLSVVAAAVSSPVGEVVINKCTLNSPEHLTLSVDTQIQKEITASSSSLNVYDSLNSSNSSNSNSSVNESLLKSSSLVEEDSTKGQFNAAPTLLEKQQESLCARLKSLKEKQGLTLGSVGISAGNRSRFSSFSESVGSACEFSLRKDDDDDLELLGKRNHSISSSLGTGDLLDQCLEEISSTSTSMSSSREPSPERYTTTSIHGKHVLTASATSTMTSNNSCNSIGEHTKPLQQQHHHLHHPLQGGDKNTIPTNVETKKSVDLA